MSGEAGAHPSEWAKCRCGPGYPSRRSLRRRPGNRLTASKVTDMMRPRATAAATRCDVKRACRLRNVVDIRCRAVHMLRWPSRAAGVGAHVAAVLRPRNPGGVIRQHRRPPARPAMRVADVGAPAISAMALMIERSRQPHGDTADEARWSISGEKSFGSASAASRQARPADDRRTHQDGLHRARSFRYAGHSAESHPCSGHDARSRRNAAGHHDRGDVLIEAFRHLEEREEFVRPSVVARSAGARIPPG